jgi:pyrophosphatase PpaX
MYKYIVFDFDGTLVDTNYLIDQTIRNTSREVLDKEVDESVIASIWGKVLTEQMAGLDINRVDELTEFYRKYYNEHRDDHTNLFEGIIEMLDKLHEMGCQMAIVTNKGNNGLEHGLNKFSMKDYFRIALSKTDVEMKKPHPEGLYKVMEHFQAKAEEVLFIGDSVHDIECGKNAGVDTVLVKWTVMDLEKLKLEEPTYIVDKPEDIINLIKLK